MSRWKASAIHLVASVLIALTVIAVIAFVWYPGPLFEATGSRELVVLLIGIDVAIGPLITLIVYREGKRGMRFDLVFIAVCQVAALIYGLHVFLAVRPGFYVFAVDRFVAVPASQLSTEDLAAARDARYRRVPWTGPKLVAAKLPTGGPELQELTQSAFSGKDVERFPKYYEPYENQRDSVLARAAPLADLAALGGRAGAEVDAFVAAHGGNVDEFAYIPFHIPRRIMTGVVRRSDASFVDILPIEPPGRAP